jgi:hypothetical protein
MKIIWHDFIDVMNFIFIASDIWIMWSIFLIAIVSIVMIGKNK